MLAPAIFAMDPQRENTPNTWELYRCCLLRTLFSYDGLGGPSSTQPQPDLASGPPDVSIDGLTWTFHLRPDLHYAPPLQGVPITSADIVRALLRSGDPKTGDPGLASFFDVIRGFSAYVSGRSDTISGLETPDPLTLRIHENRSDATLPYLLARAGTAPIPPLPDSPDAPLGVSTGHDRSDSTSETGGYGRFLVASGPYMYEGSEAMDFSLPPERQKPATGFDPWVLPDEFSGDIDTVRHWGSITLVRNPSWDPATDPLRAALPDRIEIHGGDPSELFRDVTNGKLDMVFDNVGPPALLRRYQNDPALRQLIVSADGNAETYTTFNLAQPPFDDIEVRRAVADGMNRAIVLEASRGNYIEDLLTLADHLTPDTMEASLLATWSPFPGPNGAGDMGAAHREMARSRYASGARCAAPACAGVTVLLHPGLDRAIPSIRTTLARLGIRATVEAPAGSDFWDRCQDPTAHIAMCVGLGWAADFPNAANFMGPMFSSAGIGYGNYSLMGAKPAQLAGWGYPIRHLPSIDSDVERCVQEVGATQPECWASVDQKLFTMFMPAVPLAFIRPIRLSSSRLGPFTTWDEALSEPALDRLRVDAG